MERKHVPLDGQLFVGCLLDVYHNLLSMPGRSLKLCLSLSFDTALLVTKRVLVNLTCPDFTSNQKI